MFARLARLARAFGCYARLDVVPRSQRGARSIERGAGAVVQLQACIRGISHARKMRGDDAVMLACDGRTRPSVSSRHGEHLERTRWHGHRKLREQAVAHVWNVDECGHDRDSWAENLYHYARCSSANQTFAWAEGRPRERQSQFSSTMARSHGARLTASSVFTARDVSRSVPALCR